jgi:hypothetical protein
MFTKYVRWQLGKENIFRAFLLPSSVLFDPHASSPVFNPSTINQKHYSSDSSSSSSGPTTIEPSFIVQTGQAPIRAIAPLRHAPSGTFGADGFLMMSQATDTG